MFFYVIKRVLCSVGAGNQVLVQYSDGSSESCNHEMLAPNEMKVHCFENNRQTFMWKTGIILMERWCEKVGGKKRARNKNKGQSRSS